MHADMIVRLVLGLLIIAGSVAITARRLVFLARVIRIAQPAPGRLDELPRRVGLNNVSRPAEALLRADPRVSVVLAPQPGVSPSRDGSTAIVQGGAAGDANAMVRAADDLTDPVSKLATSNVSVNLTGDSALWSDFNKVNHAAMIKSEVLSWPVTMIVLVLAFGRLVAAGLPPMLTMIGLLTAAGALVISTHIAPVSVWALNFAMMFAVALGIDYALFLVVRFRAALRRRDAQPGDRQASIDAIAETMGTAGNAIAFSGVTVLVSLSTVLLVPSPAFRSMALGIMLSVIAVLAATLTLLPAVLGKLGTKVDAGHVRLPGSRRRDARHATTVAAAATTASAPASDGSTAEVPRRALELHLHRWGALLHRPPLTRRRPRRCRPRGPRRAGSRPAHRHAVDHDHPGRPACPRRLQPGRVVVRPGAPGMVQVLTPATDASAAQQALTADTGIAATIPAGRTTAGRC